MPIDDAATSLEIYKVAVEMADRMSARRATVNTFFLTLNTALAGFVGVVSAARRPPPHGSLPTFDAFGLVVTAIAGVTMSLTWGALIRYYRRMSGAKFAVIQSIEERLPERPYTDEWKLLYPDDVVMGRREAFWQRALRYGRHREATILEQIVPFVFIAIYIVLAVRVAR